MKKTLLLLLPLFVLISFASCEKRDKLKDEKEWGDKKEDWGDKEDCITLVYPVTYTMPDESTVTGEDEKAIWTEMKDWYENNSESEGKPTLNYPVDVIILESETTETVENEEAMIALKKDCKDGENWGELELCEWDEATEASGDEFEKHTVKELVYSEDCGCYISGFEKFLENGQTKFLIYYKSDDCVGYGYKVTCENGDCETEATQKCKFLQICGE